jgi:hypothetical protein
MKPVLKSVFALLLAALPLGSVACATDVDEEEADVSEDELVASFDRRGQIDLQKTSHLLLVGDSHHLGELPLWSATTKARRIAQLYPNDQIVLFITKDVREAQVPRAGATVVQGNPFGSVALSDLRRLSSTKLIAAMDRFPKIASIEFFGHSSPFGALVEASGEDRSLTPGNLSVLADNFERSRNPYVALNGCNGAAVLAPSLSKTWRVPVSGALTGSNFQILMSDGRWYTNEDVWTPPNLSPATKNDKSFGPGVAPACTAGACVRMKPQDAPYRGVWANPDTGFQYGLGHYKFFCDYADDGSCAKGMAASLYSFPSTKPIDARSSDADFKDAAADFLCNTNKDPAWFDQCKAKLFAAAANGTGLSTMRYGGEYGHECDFAKCEQKLRCTEVNGVAQQKTCAWVSAACRPNQSAASCRPKNTTNQTTPRELKKFLDGHKLLRGR